MRILVFSVLLAILLPVGFVALRSSSSTPVAEASVCSFSQSGSPAARHLGFKREIIPLRGIKASISSYYFSPVWDGSSVWVAVNRVDPIRWAQVGYIRWGGDNQIRIFSQYTGDNFNIYTGEDLHTRYLNLSTGNWQTGYGSSPSGTQTYEVMLYVNVGGPGIHQYQIKYHGGGNSQNLTLQWTPTKWEVDAEQRNFGTPDKGDHAGGGTQNKIPAQFIKCANGENQWVDGSGYTAFDNNSHGELTAIQFADFGWPGYQFWDWRCSY